MGKVKEKKTKQTLIKCHENHKTDIYTVFVFIF